MTFNPVAPASVYSVAKLTSKATIIVVAAAEVGTFLPQLSKQHSYIVCTAELLGASHLVR